MIVPHRRAVPLLASLLVLGWFGCSSTDDLFSDPEGAGTAGTPTAGAGAGVPPGGSAGTSAGSASGGSPSGGQSGSGPTTGGTGASGGTSAGGTSAGEAGAETGGTDNGGTAGTDTGGMGGSTGGMAGSATGGTAGSATGGMAGSATGGMAGSATGGMAGAGTAGGGGAGCTSDGDCHDAEYCRKENCNAAMGRCSARREQCTGDNAELMPVCGCNGITYYSECVAAHDGVNVAQSGECSPSSAVPCTRDGGGEDCMVESSRARCYRNRSNCAATSPTEGVCWVLPEECPDEPETTRYCGGTAGQARCVALCEILEAEDSFFRDAPACANN